MLIIPIYLYQKITRCPAAVVLSLLRQILLYGPFGFLDLLPSTIPIIQLYLCYLVGSGSETLYIEVHDHASSAVALFISAVIYAGIFGYLYYDIYVNVDRKEELKKWIIERRKLQQLKELDMMPDGQYQLREYSK